MTDHTPTAPESEPLGPAPEPQQRTPLNVPALTIAAAIGLVLGIGGTLGVQAANAGISALTATPTPTAEKDTRLYDAWAACGGHDGMTLGDDDTTLTIDVKGKEDLRGASYDAEECILRYLSVPSSVSSHIGQTTAMDGRQTESWDGITIEWSYHPDRGSDMIVKLDKS